MIFLTVDEIKRLHTKLTAKTGGSDGLRDEGLLESPVYGAYAEHFGEAAYPTLEEKAARLMYALAKNHPFVDGNKRIGVLVMLVTLRLNGVHLRFTQAELTRLGLGAADGSADYGAILGFIREHN